MIPRRSASVRTHTSLQQSAPPTAPTCRCGISPPRAAASQQNTPPFLATTYQLFVCLSGCRPTSPECTDATRHPAHMYNDWQSLESHMKPAAVKLLHATCLRTIFMKIILVFSACSLAGVQQRVNICIWTTEERVCGLKTESEQLLFAKNPDVQTAGSLQPVLWLTGFMDVVCAHEKFNGRVLFLIWKLNRR